MDEERDWWAAQLAEVNAERDLLLWLHAEAVWQRDRAEGSRQDWAIEAAGMDALAERILTFHAQHEERLSFIARRYLAPGRHRDRFTGASSDALAWFAVGRRGEPKTGEYPADERDLAACERTYEMAPEFLQERMLPVLERYRAAVRGGAVHPDGAR